jgi:hypothetical protein
MKVNHEEIPRRRNHGRKETGFQKRRRKIKKGKE